MLEPQIARTYRQVSEIFGVARTTLEKWVGRRDLPIKKDEQGSLIVTPWTGVCLITLKLSKRAHLRRKVIREVCRDLTRERKRLRPGERLYLVVDRKGQNGYPLRAKKPPLIGIKVIAAYDISALEAALKNTLERNQAAPAAEKFQVAA